jgi:hypothetical protein
MRDEGVVIQVEQSFFHPSSLPPSSLLLSLPVHSFSALTSSTTNASQDFSASCQHETALRFVLAVAVTA